MISWYPSLLSFTKLKTHINWNRSHVPLRKQTNPVLVHDVQWKHDITIIELRCLPLFPWPNAYIHACKLKSREEPDPNSLSRPPRIYMNSLCTHSNPILLSKLKKMHSTLEPTFVWYSSWRQHQLKASFNSSTTQNGIVRDHIKQTPSLVLRVYFICQVFFVSCLPASKGPWITVDNN